MKAVKISKVLISFQLLFTVTVPSFVVAESLDKHPGKELYRTKGCQGCHGEMGAQKTIDAPNLAGQTKSYLQSQIEFIESQARESSADQFGNQRTFGMVAAVHNAGKADIDQITDYLSKLPLAAPVRLTPPFSEQERKDGAELFLAKGCVACHGALGKSPKEPSYPIIAGQRASYIERQLIEFRDSLRVSGHSREMLAMSKQLSDEQVKLLARYISQLSR